MGEMADFPSDELDINDDFGYDDFDVDCCLDCGEEFEDCECDLDGD